MCDSSGRLRRSSAAVDDDDDVDDDDHDDEKQAQVRHCQTLVTSLALPRVVEPLQA